MWCLLLHLGIPEALLCPKGHSNTMKAIKDLGAELPIHHLQVLLPPLFLKLFIFYTNNWPSWKLFRANCARGGFNCQSAVKSDAYENVIQLRTARGLGNEVDDFAQVAHVDAPLVHGLCQGRPVHREHRVIQAVLHLHSTDKFLLLRASRKERIKKKKRKEK